MPKAMNERAVILEGLTDILERGEYTDRTLSGLLLKYGDIDWHMRALITRELTGVVENKLYLDYIISLDSKVKPDKMKPVIRNILRMAVYEMYYMDSIRAYASVDEAVKLAKRRGYAGLSGFVNGVLRAAAARREGEQGDGGAAVHGTARRDGAPGIPPRLRYSIPDEIWELWVREYGEAEAAGFAAAFAGQDKGALTIRACNTDAGSLREALRAQGAQVEDIALEDIFGKKVHGLSVKGLQRPEANSEFIKGRFYIQDISSMAVAIAADPKPGDRVIDVCGAPGGKATHIAELLEGTGHVKARDVSREKVRLIEDNITRLGLSNISARVWDARVLEEKSLGTADIVLADLPCSGLGVIGKKPDIRYHFTQEKMHELSKMQEKILDTVQNYVKPGGRLVYSTCTMTREENGENVDKFLNRHLNFIEIGRRQILPGASPDRDGFFICVMERRG